MSECNLKSQGDCNSTKEFKSQGDCNTSLVEFKWTIAEPYERSRRVKHVFELENQQMTKELEQNAYSNALNYDENIWDVLNQTHLLSAPNPVNKRELLHHRTAERDQIQQKKITLF